MKGRRVAGYTNNTAKAVHRGNDINATHIRVCPESRYKKCTKEKGCQELRPRCDWDASALIGKDYTKKITKADYAKIDRKLLAALKQCKPVTVKLTVNE